MVDFDWWLGFCQASLRQVRRKLIHCHPFPVPISSLGRKQSEKCQEKFERELKNIHYFLEAAVSPTFERAIFEELIIKVTERAIEQAIVAFQGILEWECEIISTQQSESLGEVYEVLTWGLQGKLWKKRIEKVTFIFKTQRL